MILQLSRASNPQNVENTQIIRNRGYRVEEQGISLDSDTPMFMAIALWFRPRRKLPPILRHKLPPAINSGIINRLALGFLS